MSYMTDEIVSLGAYGTHHTIPATLQHHANTKNLKIGSIDIYFIMNTPGRENKEYIHVCHVTNV